MPVWRIEAIEEMLMIEPPPCPAITGMTCFMARKALLRLTAKTRSQSASASSTTPPTNAMPTLLSSTSMRPKVETQASTTAATSAALLTSARHAAAWPPSSLMIRAVSSAAAGLISAQNTRAPSRANATAVALPLPHPGPIEPAPTTSATFPLRRSAMRSSRLQRFSFSFAFFSFLGVELAQLGLEDLAVIVLRQRAHEHIILRPFESRDAVEAQRIELGAVGVADHISDDDLAPLRIGPPDYRDLADVYVLEQDFLDLARIDVGAAGDDNVLGAVFERQIAFGIECADVAGVQPAAAQGRCRRLRIVPVARHHHVAAAQNFTGLAGRQRAIVAVGDHHFEPAEGPAGGAQPLGPAWMTAVGNLLLRQSGNGHRAFALAVDLREARAEAVDGGARVGDIHGRAAPDDGLDMIGIALRVAFNEPLDHGGCGEHRRARPGVDQAHYFVGFKTARFRHHVDAAPRHVRHHVKARAVAHRRRVQ